MKLKTITFTETIAEISKEFSTKIVEYTKVTDAQQNKILKLETEWNEIHQKDTEIENLQGIIQGMEQNNHTLAKEIQSRTTDERNKKKGNATRRNEGRQFDRGNERRNNSEKSILENPTRRIESHDTRNNSQPGTVRRPPENK